MTFHSGRGEPVARVADFLHPLGYRASKANARARQTGHLFQGRFGSVAFDEDHLMNAGRYVALNPAPAGLAPRAEDWPHSSVRAIRPMRGDGFVSVKPLKRPRAAFRRPCRGRARRGRLRPHQARAELIGRPLGSAAFVAAIERSLGRALAPGHFRARWLAYRRPCRRFAPGLTADDARLGADAVRYPFIVVDWRHLLLASSTTSEPDTLPSTMFDRCPSTDSRSTARSSLPCRSTARPPRS